MSYFRSYFKKNNTIISNKIVVPPTPTPTSPSTPTVTPTVTITNQ